MERIRDVFDNIFKRLRPIKKQIDRLSDRSIGLEVDGVTEIRATVPDAIASMMVSHRGEELEQTTMTIQNLASLNKVMRNAYTRGAEGVIQRMFDDLGGIGEKDDNEPEKQLADLVANMSEVIIVGNGPFPGGKKLVMESFSETSLGAALLKIPGINRMVSSAKVPKRFENDGRKIKDHVVSTEIDDVTEFAYALKGLVDSLEDMRQRFSYIGKLKFPGEAYGTWVMHTQLDPKAIDTKFYSAHVRKHMANSGILNFPPVLMTEMYKTLVAGIKYGESLIASAEVGKK